MKPANGNKYINFSLKDYTKLRTPFCFFDETGNLNDKANRYFAMGMLKCSQPYYLDYEVQRLRQKEKFYDEIKFNKISRKNIDFALKVLDTVFSMPGLKFSFFVINKDDVDFHTEFKNDLWLAYEVFAEKLLIGNISPREIVIVLADYVTTPPTVKFEVNVKHSVNNHFKRLAVAGVCRVDSKGVNLVQIVDLVLGATVYDYKLTNKLATGDKHKIKLLNYLKKKLKLKTFVGGFRNSGFNLFEYRVKQKNGPSS